MVIDLDRFKQVNDSVGIAVGNSILLTIARRLGRLLKPQDTLARLSGDQFGLLLLSEREPPRIPRCRHACASTLRAPITFNDREILLTASIGLALADSTPQRKEDVLKDAELAMYHAKRIGGDRIEVFKPAMRARKTDRLTMEIRTAPRARSPRPSGPPATRSAGTARDLVALERAAQVGFHREAVALARAHRRLEHLDAVAADALAVIHRKLGVLQHVLLALRLCRRRARGRSRR